LNKGQSGPTSWQQNKSYYINFAKLADSRTW